MKHILPPLHDEANVPPCAKSGQWIEADNLLLGNLAESINVPELEKKSEELVSIPDTWARPAVVTNALYDPKHPSHNTIQSEWRGLLALFALMPYHKQVLETTIVNLNVLKDNPFKVALQKNTNFAYFCATIW